VGIKSGAHQCCFQQMNRWNPMGYLSWSFWAESSLNQSQNMNQSQNIKSKYFVLLNVSSFYCHRLTIISQGNFFWFISGNL
jgi:hypothetical protein